MLKPKLTTLVLIICPLVMFSFSSSSFSKQCTDSQLQSLEVQINSQKKVVKIYEKSTIASMKKQQKRQKEMLNKLIKKYEVCKKVDSPPKKCASIKDGIKKNEKYLEKYSDNESMVSKNKFQLKNLIVDLETCETLEIVEVGKSLFDAYQKQLTELITLEKKSRSKTADCSKIHYDTLATRSKLEQSHQQFKSGKAGYDEETYNDHKFKYESQIEKKIKEYENCMASIDNNKLEESEMKLRKLLNQYEKQISFEKRVENVIEDVAKVSKSYVNDIDKSTITGKVYTDIGIAKQEYGNAIDDRDISKEIFVRSGKIDHKVSWLTSSIDACNRNECSESQRAQERNKAIEKLFDLEMMLHRYHIAKKHYLMSERELISIRKGYSDIQ